MNIPNPVLIWFIFFCHESLWLNEGFATYCEELVGTPFILPDNGKSERFVSDVMQPVMEDDALQSSHQMSVPINDAANTYMIVDSITYDKGATVVRMMTHFLREDTFMRGITRYLNNYTYGNAEQDDLWKVLNEVGHEEGTLGPELDMKEIMDTWTLQPGYPVVTVTRNYSNEHSQDINLKQQRFLMFGDDLVGESNEYKWWIPISFTTTKVADFTDTSCSFWFKSDAEMNATINIDKEDALIVNIQETGYYRVNYDGQNWKLIADALFTDHLSLHQINRAQILNDAFSLARGNQFNYNLALIQTLYMKNEKEYVPWSAALSGFEYLDLMLGPDSTVFRKYLVSQLEPIYEELEFYQDGDDSFLNVILRTKIVDRLCNLQYSDCVEKAHTEFKTWMEMEDPDLDNNIDNSIRSTVYCTSLFNGNDAEWNFMFERMLNAEKKSDKNIMLSSLGCSSDEIQLQVR